jgi:hypothetical protein
MLRIALSVVLGGTLMVGFASAQPSSYYGFRGDPPPRPPAAVPDGNVPPPPQYPPQYPPQNSGQYPAPPPQAATGPAPSAIQAQPLPPPPGGAPPPPGAQQRAHASQPGAPGTTGSAPADAQPPAPMPQPDDTVVTEMPTAKIENTRAVFAGLDKITGRITAFDAAIGETVQFGALQVTPRACYTRPPTETPLTDGFVEVAEVTLQGEVRRIFTGWMFAASPGLHAVEHAIYDVWLTDCKGGVQAVAEAPPPPPPVAAPAARPPAQPRPPAPQRQPPRQPPTGAVLQPPLIR